MLPTPPFDVPFTLGAQLDARAGHAAVESRIALRQGLRSWTYRQFRDEAVRVAHFLLRRLGPVGDDRPGHVAMFLENHLELMSLIAGCGYGGLTLFGLNTGLRGDALAGVLNRSRARVLVVDERLWPEVERVRAKLTDLVSENILVLRTQSEDSLGNRDYLDRLADEVAAEGASLDTPAIDVAPDSNLVVIYTSGTTGLPKGINNDHRKLLIIGQTVGTNLQLGPDDVGYACMPLFHSNALFLGFQPALHACGTLSMRERFSATNFVPDILRYGVTYWNYVGEPVHYILAALDREFRGDEARILAEVAGSRRNRLRFAIGNGAAPPDIDRFIRWLGLEDMLELYGSTEAAISTFRKLGDPRGSVGEIADPAVRILNEHGEECPPAELDADGTICNYAEAVGEICRVADDTGLFQGYFADAQANESKYRTGIYHSGDLGHVQRVGETRFLFFDGRTDDWIRKDGENFSAAQVARVLQEHDDVVLAAAYGAPCAVSDELVMVALKLREGARFDPQKFFDYCQHATTHGGMDPKWFPDFVRVVSEFEYTQTQKVLVRNLKAVQFDRRRLPDEPIYWRQRGDTTYREFTKADFEELQKSFEASERGHLLDR
ncbi:MAG: AMP-binding protein [Myxococcota bacterium]